MEKINLQLSYNELDALTELVFLGNEVMNSQRKTRKLKYDNLYNKIAMEYKIQTLNKHPKRADDLRNMRDYLIDCCMDYLIDYENANFTELLAWKLTRIKGDVPKIRDTIKKSKLFE